jgi:Uma2 family endonuclease
MLDIFGWCSVRYHGLSDRLFSAMEEMPTRVVLTYREYEALPADGRRYELHDGELLVTAAPGLPHQRVVGELFALLRQHVRAGRLGEVFVSPVDCILSDTTIVQPDLVFLDTARSSIATPRGIEGPPTLAIEVVSHSTARVDRGAKLQLYARHGIPHYWIVDPEARSIEALVLATGSYQLAARLAGADRGSLPPFDGLTIALEPLWS